MTIQLYSSTKFKLFCCRVYASLDWIQSQIPDIIKNGVERLGDDTDDIDDMDAEVFVQAYVNIVAGACISLGRMQFMFYGNINLYVVFWCLY